MLIEMSRRSRRRAGKSKASGGWWIRVMIAVFALVMLTIGVGWMWLRSWLHSEDFRVLLSLRASESLNADAEFGEFKWDGTSVATRSFNANGIGAVQEFEAQGLSMDIGLDHLGDRVVELRNAKINSIDLKLDLRGDTLANQEQIQPEVEEEYEPPAWYEKWIPNDFRLTGLEVGQSAVSMTLDDGDINFDGTSWEVTPGDVRQTYEVHAKGGVITFPWSFAPEMEMNSIHLRNTEDAIFLTDSDFRIYDNGVLKLTGEASLEGDDFALNGSIEDVYAGDILNEDWSQKLEGRIESEFSAEGGPNGPQVSGSVSLHDGVLTGLPVLDALGAYGGSPRFRRLILSEATTDFMWEDQNLVLYNFKLGSEGLMRVEGRIKVDKNDFIDGTFRVGLTPGTLKLIPGAETKVFLPGERGLLWTTVNITGTVDKPEEDLTDRLIMAAGMRMFELVPETGERVLKYTNTQISPENLNRLIKEGEGVIDQGKGLLDTGKGIIDGDIDIIDNADDVIRQGTDVVREVEGLFDILQGDIKPDPKEEPAKVD